MPFFILIFLSMIIPAEDLISVMGKDKNTCHFLLGSNKTKSAWAMFEVNGREPSGCSIWTIFFIAIGIAWIKEKLKIV